jgi:hypothetical protein
MMSEASNQDLVKKGKTLVFQENQTAENPQHEPSSHPQNQALAEVQSDQTIPPSPPEMNGTGETVVQSKNNPPSPPKNEEKQPDLIATEKKEANNLTDNTDASSFPVRGLFDGFERFGRFAKTFVAK